MGENREKGRKTKKKKKTLQKCQKETYKAIWIGNEIEYIKEIDT